MAILHQPYLRADFTFEEADALLDAGSSDTCEHARRNLGDVMTLGAVLAARADVGAVAQVRRDVAIGAAGGQLEESRGEAAVGRPEQCVAAYPHAL